jgi:hypothetical protein
MDTMADDQRRALYVPGYDDEIAHAPPRRGVWARIGPWLVALAVIGIVVALVRLYLTATDNAALGPPVVIAPEGPYREQVATEVPGEDLTIYERVVDPAASGVAAAPQDAPQDVSAPAPSGEVAADIDAAALGEARSPAILASGAGPGGAFDPQFRPDFARSGTLFAQVAALRSEAAAIEAWRRLANRAPALFPEPSRDIERADLGARGIYFRLRAGPFASEAAIEAYCAQVQSLGQDCIMVAS